jgi:hypothetical protein
VPTSYHHIISLIPQTPRIKAGLLTLFRMSNLFAPRPGQGMGRLVVEARPQRVAMAPVVVLTLVGLLAVGLKLVEMLSKIPVASCHPWEGLAESDH